MKSKLKPIHLMIVAVFILTGRSVFSQTKERQTGDTTYYKTLIPEEKQGLLKNMSFIANMRFNEQNNFNNGDYQNSKFVNEQFRLEIKGQAHERVYFRLRERYTRAQDPQSIDGISRSTDLAYIKVKVTDKFKIAAGKMCAAWGAYEFDYNPIDIYAYSDIIEFADNFLTGVSFEYQANKNHGFTFQALDSRTKSFNELYGNQPNKIESKAPLALVGNWTGSMFDGKFNTIWSYALHTECENTFMHYFAFGNQFKLTKKLTLEYDYKYSAEQLDRTGVVSATVPDSIYPYAVENTLNTGHWLHIYYRASKKINLAFVGMMDVSQWKANNIPGKTTDDIYTAWGFIPTIEYYPFENLNLRFYVNYVGRVYEYSDYAKQKAGVRDYSTGKLSIGFVSPLGIF